MPRSVFKQSLGQVKNYLQLRPPPAATIFIIYLPFTNISWPPRPFPSSPFQSLRIFRSLLLRFTDDDFSFFVSFTPDDDELVAASFINPNSSRTNLNLDKNSFHIMYQPAKKYTNNNNYLIVK